MKLIENQFNENLYLFKTSTGLRVQYLHRPGFKKSSAVLAVPFGGKDRYQVVDGVKIEHPLGIAHFLEHKLFEDEGVDVLNLFTALGANGNAFTSYYETMYYFSHPQELKSSLRLLLQFVRRFKIDEASVEKEKPIIIEELKMYQQMPEMRLLHEVKNAVYQEHGYKYDIAGTVESVQGTTLEDLEKAYRYNYADERMVLTIIAPDKPDEVKAYLDEICTEQQSNTHQGFDVKEVLAKESYHVVEKEKVIESHFQKNRVAIAYKFDFKTENASLSEEMLDYILELNFSSINEDYQKALDQGIISNRFVYMSDIDADVAVVYFFNDSDQTEAFAEWIDEKMKNLRLDEEDFKAVHRKNFGNMIFNLSNFEQLAVEMARHRLRGRDYFHQLLSYSKITLQDLHQVLSQLKNFEKTQVWLKGKE